MIWLSMAVFAGSVALVGGVKALKEGRPNLAQMLALPAKPETSHAEDLQCQRQLNWSAVVLAAALAVRHLSMMPLGLAITPLLVYLEWPWIKAAWSDLVAHHTIKSIGLMTITFSGGWIYGAYVGSAIGIFAFLLSRKITLSTRISSRKKLIGLFDCQPQTLWLLVEGVEVETPFHQVQAGDTVVIYAGESIPVDGIVIAGMATVDQHRLTGQAQPVERGMGDGVLAATLVLRGWLHVQVDKAGQETVAMKLAEILGRTASYPLAVEQQGLKLAENCSIPSVALGVATLPLLGFGSAVSVFFARPGIDMDYAAPLTLMNFLYVTASHGILVRDGRSLELMRGIDTVVFDKTGTLVMEQPELINTHTCGKFEKWQVLSYAAGAAYRQSHPIAKAILEEARQCGLKIPDVGETRCEVGFGVQVCIGNQTVRVGSLGFISKERLSLPPMLAKTQQQSEEFGHSLVFVAVDEVLAGALELRPSLRPEAQEIIAELKRRGLKLAMLSGDHIETPRHVAERLGIEEFFADVLPEDKVRYIERLQQEGRSVCFVGDGISDVIAHKTAHVSVSMHGATSIATNTAQIVLMDQSLKQLPLLFDLSKRLDSNLKLSLGMSIAAGASIIGGIFLFHGGIGGMAILRSIAVIPIIGNAMLPLLNTGKSAGQQSFPSPRHGPKPSV